MAAALDLKQEPGTTRATFAQECWHGYSLCAPGQQEIDGRVLPAGTGLRQRGVALCVLLGQVSSGSCQQVDDLQMALAGRKMQRGPTAGDGVTRDSATLSCKVMILPRGRAEVLTCIELLPLLAEAQGRLQAEPSGSWTLSRMGSVPWSPC